MHILDPFGPVWDAAGVRGFAREGYWFHRLIPGLSFKGSTFVTKTLTTYPHEGNMKLREDFTPLRLFPDCIWVDPPMGMTLNSVGLSGPGAEAILGTGRLTEIEDPFFISWMPVRKSRDEQVDEAEEFIRILRPHLQLFLSNHVGIQLNISCPNVGASLSTAVEKAHTLLSILKVLGLPIVVKLNLTVSPEDAVKIARHPACAGICTTNTIPFGKIIPKEDWDFYFPNGSPLWKRNEQYGEGGLSGPMLLPYLQLWLERFRRIDPVSYINAGGGVWWEDDVDELLRDYGANSVFIGSVAMLRPWRVRSIIERAHRV